jgi:hypothetical protein
MHSSREICCNGFLANVMLLRYPPIRHNQKTMLMIVNIHPFLLEPAKAASSLPCQETPMDIGRSSGNETALATRRMR